jgi:hypothetical protein
MQIYTIEKDFGESYNDLLDAFVYPCMVIKLYSNEMLYYTSKENKIVLGNIHRINEVETKTNNTLKQMFYAFGAVVPEAIGTDIVGIYQDQPIIE